MNAIIHPTLAEYEAGWNAFALDRTGGAGIVDHVSFVVMRRLGVTRAFTNDVHFRIAGFETLF